MTWSLTIPCSFRQFVFFFDFEFSLALKVFSSFLFAVVITLVLVVQHSIEKRPETTVYPMHVPHPEDLLCASGM